jgi:TRAP-type C4-dicarboxylate transport system permease small subunit
MKPEPHLFEEPGHRIETIICGPGLIEYASEAISSLALVVMIVLIGAEAIIRNLFGGSLQITDEIGGYLLVAVTFLSMSVSEAHGAFHRVELVQARMGRGARIWLQIAFDACSLVTSLLVTWQLGRLAVNGWNSGDVAPTPLQTPLWLPQMVMGIGMAFLCFALVRSALAKYRFLQREASA